MCDSRIQGVVNCYSISVILKKIVVRLRHM